jgi:hypothetical protein
MFECRRHILQCPSRIVNNVTRKLCLTNKTRLVEKNRLINFDFYKKYNMRCYRKSIKKHNYKTIGNRHLRRGRPYNR